MATTIYTRRNHGEVRRLLAMVPGICSGRFADQGGAARGLQMRLGVVLLSLIQEAFIAKAKGGVDAAGESWQPLAQATIANRRPAPRKKLGERPRGMLTAEQDKRWRALFARALHGLAKKYGQAGAYAAADIKGHAAAYAWQQLKLEGAKTKLEVFGHRKLEILRDTGRGFNSLSPGVDGPSGNPDQVFKVEPGAVIVGTNVKYMVAHHKGTMRLPQRRLWPERIPPVWWEDITDQARQGVIRLVSLLVAA